MIGSSSKQMHTLNLEENVTVKVNAETPCRQYRNPTTAKLYGMAQSRDMPYIQRLTHEP